MYAVYLKIQDSYTYVIQSTSYAEACRCGEILSRGGNETKIRLETHLGAQDVRFYQGGIHVLP